MAIIYKTTNLLNNMIYIGQSIYNNDKYYGSGKWLKRAIKKYGKINFKKEIIEECTENELDDKEKYWINYYKSNIIGYNLSKGGQIGWRCGSKHTEETKRKMSEKHTGTNNPWFGQHHTEESKKKMSESLKNSEIFQTAVRSNIRRNKLKIKSKIGKASFLGKHHTEEAKKKISEAHIGNKYWLGKHHTDETKKKLSEANKGQKTFLGKKHTEEWKNMMSKLHKGKIVSVETRQKMRNNNIGKIMSQKTKTKISESLKKEIYKIVNNEIVENWQSAKDASIYLNISIKKIGYYCRKKDISNKYNIIYKDDYETK